LPIIAWASVLSSEEATRLGYSRDDELADHRERVLRRVPEDSVARVCEDLEP
jgi:hypothetical protein